MNLTIALIIALIAPTWCQYYQTGLKPDVTFGDHNSRFDVKNILRNQKQYLDHALDDQSDEYRRRGRIKHKSHLNNENKDDKLKALLENHNTRKEKKHIGKSKKKIIRELEDHVNNLANTIIKKMRSMRRNQDFAYHDKMESDSKDIEDYKANLNKFAEDFVPHVPTRRLQDIVNKLHSSQKTRRFVDPEKEILLHYAFPLQINIEGFLH